MADDSIYLDDSGSSTDENDNTAEPPADSFRPKLPKKKTVNASWPPLPLIIFKGVGVRYEGVKTIDGKPIRSILNNLTHSVKGNGDHLQDLLFTRKLGRWFSARSYKEAAIRNPKAVCRAGTVGYGDHYTLRNTLVFKSTSFDSDSESPLKVPETTKSCLTFDSSFETGNLLKAVLVTGRENLMTGHTLQNLQSVPGGFATPDPVDQEYDLTVRNDLNTSGNIQWFYFSASTENIYRDGSKSMNYPLRVRFNIVNMKKKDALYNYGMKPATFSSNNTRDDWRHRGDDVCYYRRKKIGVGDISSNETRKKDNYILSFSFTFLSPTTVFFAHTFPYTYTDLKKYLALLEESHRITTIMSRKELCTTIAGNTCECVTITSRGSDQTVAARKPAIVISARIHPGESNSSYMMHGVIDFLVSDTPEAKILRDTFIFKLVPMLNPDGVIHGNYRCSLMGTDLNRKYLNANPALYPTVAAMKNLLLDCQKKRGVLLFLDLHGHSKKKNAFLYGSDCTLQSEKLSAAARSSQPPEVIDSKKIFARSFARVICTQSDANKGGYFSYPDCTFGVGSNKRSTGRVVSWRGLGILGTFTIEASFCGSGNNKEKSILKQFDDVNKVAGLNMQLQDMLKAHNHNRQGAGGGGGGANTSSKSIRSLKEEAEDRYRSLGSTKLHDFAPIEEASGIDPFVFPSLEPIPLGSYRSRRGSLTQSLHDKPSLSRKNSLHLKEEAPVRRRYKETGDLAFDKLMRSYETAVHYTKQDFRNIGRDIVQAIFCFANLELPHTSRRSSANALKPRRTSGSSTVDPDSSAEIPKEVGPVYEYEEVNAPEKGAGTGAGPNSEDSQDGTPDTPIPTSRRVVEVADAVMLGQPLLRPSVYSEEAIQNAYRSYPSEIQRTKDSFLLRLRSEISIRKSLKIACPPFILAAAVVVPIKDEMEFEKECEEEDGSDSEPSGDEIPVSDLFGKKNLKDCKSLVKVLQKAAVKMRAVSEKNSEQSQKKYRKIRAKVTADAASANAAAVSAQTREALMQLRNQRALVKVMNCKNARPIVSETNGQTKMHVLQFEADFLSPNRSSPKNQWASRRADPEPGPEFYGNLASDVLPKIERMFEMKDLTNDTNVQHMRNYRSVSQKPRDIRVPDKGRLLSSPFLFKASEDTNIMNFATMSSMDRKKSTPLPAMDYAASPGRYIPPYGIRPISGLGL